MWAERILPSASRGSTLSSSSPWPMPACGTAALLLYGGMGANKTTLVNLLGSSFLSMGLDEVERSDGDRPSGADGGEDSGLS